MLDLPDIRTQQTGAFHADVIKGLSASQKSLPSRWLYDDRGSELFEEITHLDEYYPTRTETRILQENREAIAKFCGSQATVIEYGAGAGIKTEILLNALHDPSVYIPIDIAGDFLKLTAERMKRRFPGLVVRPIVADFTVDFDLSHEAWKAGQRTAFFPGSTIGNLDDQAAAAFLQQIRRHVGWNGKAIIGVDLKKDIKTLIAAYDDREGVTAEFNLNLLARINRELHGTFPLHRFVHEARWNDRSCAIEMHLVSLDTQTVFIGKQSFNFWAGETIHTESSRKYDAQSFTQLVELNGWEMAEMWNDPHHLFGIFGLCAGPAAEK